MLVILKSRLNFNYFTALKNISCRTSNFILKSFLPDFADDDEDSGADSLNDPYLMSIGGGGSGGYGMAGTGYLSTASSQDGGLLRYAFHLHNRTFWRTLAEKFLESMAS